MVKLTVPIFKTQVRAYVKKLSGKPIPNLYGVTDGKAVGTHVEHELLNSLAGKYELERSSSASGIDIPGLGIDIKVTSVRQPQSSCPYKEAKQKIYGLGYNLLVLVYDKKDRIRPKGAVLNILHALFIEKERTADYQTTYGLLEILRRGGNKEDVIAFIEERNLPIEEIGREKLADEIIANPPVLGHLTISNALQWRLQYSRAIHVATGKENQGIEDLLG